jgi:hypothetical protein
MLGVLFLSKVHCFRPIKLKTAYAAYLPYQQEANSEIPSAQVDLAFYGETLGFVHFMWSVAHSRREENAHLVGKLVPYGFLTRSLTQEGRASTGKAFLWPFSTPRKE